MINLREIFLIESKDTEDVMRVLSPVGSGFATERQVKLLTQVCDMSISFKKDGENQYKFLLDPNKIPNDGMFMQNNRFLFIDDVSGRIHELEADTKKAYLFRAYVSKPAFDPLGYYTDKKELQSNFMKMWVPRYRIQIVEAICVARKKENNLQFAFYAFFREKK